MEHGWGRRLLSNIPVRLRCVESPDSGCRCLGSLESVSASGASIRTERGICPSAELMVEPLTAALGLKGRELPACLVRSTCGEIAIEWREFASTGVSALMTETMLAGGPSDSKSEAPALGRVRFCARAPVAVE